MAPRFPTTNGIYTNGDIPPPSTLAAQIVHNQTRQPAPQQNGEAATFSQLLHEILHNHAAAPETDVNVNVKLVNVVAEAGLAQLAEGNPFADWDTLIPRAIDSIDVIETTIKRQPEVLFTPFNADGPQLLLPLLAKLLAVCGKEKCDSLPVRRLLDSIRGTLDASIDYWPQSQTLLYIVEECMDDVLSSLENAVNTSSNFHVRIPPARSVAKLWPQSHDTIALPHGCQSSVSDRCHAFMLVLELSRLQDLSSAKANEVHFRLQRLAHQLHGVLETSKQAEFVFQELLLLPKSLPTLNYLIGNASKSPPSNSIQSSVATAMITILENDVTGLEDHLIVPTISLASDQVFDSLHEDLKIAITTVLCRVRGSNALPERVHAMQEALRQDNVMTDSALQASFQQLSVAHDHACIGPRRRKRRKLGDFIPEDHKSRMVRYVTNLLTRVESEDLNALPALAVDVYPQLEDKDKQAAWQALIDLIPIEPGTAVSTISKLIELPELQQSKQPRVLSMLAVHACIKQTSDAAYLDLARSTFGQLCLRSLHSSLREIRVVAGKALAGFLRNDLPNELKGTNCKTALEYLRVVTDRDVATLHETLVGAWGQIAQVCDGSELNLSLLQLIDYLGHANPLVCGLAFEELEALLETKSQSAEELFKPFWSSIAVSVVQDLHSRPQKIQQLCDLLGIDVSKFLVRHQENTVPSLVVTKKKDVLQRIATARGNGTTVQDLCLQPRTNLAATLTALLTHNGPDTEDTAIACLAEVAPNFRGADFANLVKIDPTLIACNLLKYIGDEGNDRKSRARLAFQTFANIAERRPGQAKSSHSKSSRTITEFFDTHILGIMTHFSEVLENMQGGHSMTEKNRCINAISEMIAIGKGQVNVALPQIRAALQSAMEQKELCEAAFSAWLNLLLVLSDEDVVLIVDQTFTLVLRHWQTLSPNMQHRLHDGIGSLIKDHNSVMKDNIMSLPSLAKIPMLSKFAGEIERHRSQNSAESYCRTFAARLRDESMTVVLRALEELWPFLEKNQEFIHVSALAEKPSPELSELLRALLDATTKYSSDNSDAAELCGKALGIIGCLDPNRIEAIRKQRRALVLSNFDAADEVIDWALVLLEDVLVKAFRSVTNARAQGFLAYVMQELLRFCGINDGTVLRPRASQAQSVHQKWLKMPDNVRITLTPFVNSRYVVTSNTAVNAPNRPYPAFNPDSGYSTWLRSLAYDLTWKAKGENAQMVFPLIGRIIRGHDLAIASFMLPYTILNVVLGGTVTEVKGITDEILAILRYQPNNAHQQETVKLCSESIFSTLDYITTWLQEKKKTLGDSRAAAYKGQSSGDFDEVKDMAQIETVERFLNSIPAEVIATQAVICGAYARALFHWEQYIRQERPLIPSIRPPEQFSDDQMLYEKLQDIYSQIDEPDGLEGISSHLAFLNEDQQAMQHAKAGRWTAAQAWYELQLADNPQDPDLEERLLDCMRETGRYEPLLRFADSFVSARNDDEDARDTLARLLPDIVEAHWMSGDLEGMKSRLRSQQVEAGSDFNVGIANTLTALGEHQDEVVLDRVKTLRKLVTQSMTVARTNSVQGSHDDLIKLHVLHEIESLGSSAFSRTEDTTAALDRRLAIIGSYVSDKQYVMGIRRSIMLSHQDKFGGLNVGSSWLTTAKLARQSGNTDNAYNAVLKAYDCGNKDAKMEEARLLWRQGHQRHAIQMLESAIGSGIFDSADTETRPDEHLRSTTIASTTSTSMTTRSSDLSAKQAPLLAKAQLLLAKWLDASGQSQSKDMTDRYQKAARSFQRWEKGHYYLGKHYQKLLEAEKPLPKDKQSLQYLSGESAKLVVDNLLRSIPFGNKYWHETIPKILTLWLDLGAQAREKPAKEDQGIFDRRVKALQHCNGQIKKYFDRIPPYVLYSAVPQMISRITHRHPEVWKMLCSLLTRIASAHPNQTLWSLLAVIKASDQVRSDRGLEIIGRLKESSKKPKDNSNVDQRIMIPQAQRLSEGLLHACEAHIEQRTSSVKLSKDLGFNHKLAPNPLVVPIEMTLTASLPNGATSVSIKHHKAFVQDRITISSFEDEVSVLNSLQRPRKLTVKGSDGKKYGILCKPKDDLRKDQRLMEFNGIINRSLKRDAESSKRRLYIKTYAVTPLSEESGIIEWVEGIKPIRDILLNIYIRKGIRPNYAELRHVLDQACASPEHAHIFTDQVLSKYPASMHEWFTEVYPEPDAWFAARLRYARTAAVMSMTGHVLGLGDRHGENILLEESTGGVFHVDFNCLFDKGLTFEKPELVPFRLTHNMVDAMGPYGYEGPFRKSSELTLRLLRQSKDTLMTILETFLYDPTTDFIGQKKKRSTANVPETPQEILDSVDGKLKGLLRGETVPLGVEGYVDALIREATNPFFLASMYIGWCAFL